MTSDNALKLSVTNAQAKPGSIGFFEDVPAHVPGAPSGVTLNDVIASIGRATAVVDASSYWTSGWFQAQRLPYEQVAPPNMPLWGLTSSIPMVGSVEILVTVRDDDKSTDVWGLVVNAS